MNAPTAATPALPTVLVVDDEPANLALLTQLLQPHYRVLAANGGAAALRAANAQPGPDLILLDLMMPELDGYEVLKRLRANATTQDIPVLFVTARSDPDDEERGLQLGANDYLTKPIHPGTLLARVRTQLEALQARRLLKKFNLKLAQQVATGTHALEQAHAQLMQADKMASIGQLAAGVAHEINNPVGFVSSNLGTLKVYLDNLLAVVAAYEQAQVAVGNNAAFAEVQALRQQLDFDHLKTDLAELLQESQDGLARVRSIVVDLKTLSHASENVWEWADIHAGLNSTLNIVWNELKYHCTVKKDYGKLPRIYCLPTQLDQVFLNLLVNAGQAIEGQGEITIRTECVGDAAVRIAISDTGTGIAPDALAKVFDAFYTTKPVGKGTGLGLSLAKSIIDRHHGKIDVASVVGQGTTFTLTLPVDAATPTDSGAVALHQRTDALHSRQRRVVVL